MPALDQLAYSIVVPCFELPEELSLTLAAIHHQERAPLEVIVVDASHDDRVRAVAAAWGDRLPMRYERAVAASAAAQRNQGGNLVDPARSPIIGFVDDDITMRPDTCGKVAEVFDTDVAGLVAGVAVRIEEIHRPEPTGWSWWYYRLQAGYRDRTYGGRLFGAAINCLPCYTETTADLIPAEWLNSGCVFYRTALFQKELFPAFAGCSFMEDVHLSARLARTHRLFFHKTALCQHRDGAAVRPHEDHRSRARMRRRHQRIVATEVLGLRGPLLEAKLLLHQLFVSISILRGRPPGWMGALLGTWL